MKKAKKRETIDLTILIIYPIIAALVSLFFKINLLASLVVFYLIPSVYLSIRNPKYVKRALIFSLILAVPSIIVIDYIAHLSESWFIPTVFAFRLLGIVSVEVILWAILAVYLTVIFYEYFLDRHITKHIWHPHMKYLVILVLLIIAIFFSLLTFSPSSLKIPYFYFWLGFFFFFVYQLF